MSDRIALDDVEPEQFDKLIDLLVEWISEKSVKIRIRPSSRVVLEFDGNDLSRQIESSELPEECLIQLKVDIPTMLSGILSGHRPVIRNFFANQSIALDQEEDSELDAERIRTEISHRMALVEEKIATADVRQQFAIKRTAKTSLLQELSWEVVERRSESTGDSPSNLVFSTIRLEAQKPPSSEDGNDLSFLPLVYNPFHRPETEAITLTLTLEDIQDLAEDFEKILKSLKQAITESSER